MKNKLKIIFIILIVLSGFVFYHSRKDDINLAKELESIDGANLKSTSNSSVWSYVFPFLKSDFQKKIERGESVTFLLLGYGGEGHSGAYLTDTMILGRMNFGTGEVTLMNLPRDLWVQGQKLNVYYAVSQDGAKVADTLADLLDIPIDYYVGIDFDGFREAVDELGGLDIYVETTFDDYQYPRHDNDQVDAGVMAIHFDEGWEKMNGERSLQYARSRYSLEDGGDYNRAKRQQKVIQAFKDKALETRDIRVLFNVMKLVTDHFETDFPYVEGLSVYQYITKNQIQTKSKILSEENYLYSTYNEEGSFILLPKDNDWSAIKDYFNAESENLP